MKLSKVDPNDLPETFIMAAHLSVSADKALAKEDAVPTNVTAPIPAPLLTSKGFLILDEAHASFVSKEDKNALYEIFRIENSKKQIKVSYKEWQESVKSTNPLAEKMLQQNTIKDELVNNVYQISATQEAPKASNKDFLLAVYHKESKGEDFQDWLEMTALKYHSSKEDLSVGFGASKIVESIKPNLDLLSRKHEQDQPHLHN